MRQTRYSNSSTGRQVFLVLVFGSVLFRVEFGNPALGADYSPEVTQAIQRGVAFLAKTDFVGGSGHEALIAYAIMTGRKGAANDPLVAGNIQEILKKIKKDKYTPQANHFYEAGIDMMTLEAADPVRYRYRPQMEAIVQYILKGQKAGGHWFYEDQKDTGGDTSITQYSILGLWAATRAGIDVPKEAFSKAVTWHLKTQQGDGSFTYNPPAPLPAAYHAMTTAGMGSLLICKLHLYPNSSNPLATKKSKPKSTTKFGGIAKKINVDSDKSDVKTGGVKSASERAINNAISRGNGWLRSHFMIDGRIGPIARYPMYYLYTLERMASLAKLHEIGGRDWYAEGSDLLIRTQAKDGSWRFLQGSSQDTAFAILFLARATGKIVGQTGPRFGDGLMRGGAELTKVKDFTELEIRNGKVQIRKNLGPLDELLAELQKPRSDNLAATTNAIVEKVQLGDREGLVGNKALLLKLVKNPQADVRRIALWALARTADFGDVSLFMKALDDPNIDVVVEGHNALCFLSRKPKGFGLPASPQGRISEEDTEATKLKKANIWRADVRKAWKTWYLKVRPYEERNDIEDVRKR